MKKRKTTKKKSNGQLAVYQGPPAPEEIEKINQEHRSIVLAGRSMLPRAIKIGVWFLKCRLRVAPGDWGAWSKSAFPQMSLTQIRLYVRLAQHQQYLETKFQINAENVAATVDFERFVSIKEADTAIRDMRRDLKEQSKNARSIDVEATVSSSDGQGEAVQGTVEGPQEETDQPMFGERGVRLPTEGVIAEPLEILQEKVRDYIGYLALTQERGEEVLEWIQAAGLSDSDVQHAIEVACVEREQFEPYVQHLIDSHLTKPLS